MPIDPNIPLGVRPAQLENPMNALAQAQQFGLNNLKMQEAEQIMSDRDAVRGLDINAPDYISRVGRVNPKLALELQQGQTKNKAAQVELEANLMKNARNTLAPIQDQGTYDLWRQQVSAQLPGLTQFLPAKFDDKVKTSLMLEADKYIQQTQLSANQKAQLGQSQAHFEANFNKPVFNAEAGGWVVPPRIGKDGTASFAGTVIPVAGMTTKTTEGEKQSAFNAKRLLSAATTITKQVEKDASSTAPGTWEAMQPTEGMANLSRSPERQIVASNYADLIDAALYLATGAAYNKEQLEAQRQAYLPVWSDSPENRVQKQQKTVDLINAAKVRAGKNWTPDLDVAVSKLFPTAMEQSEAAPTTSKGNKPSLNDIFNPKK